MRTPPSVVGSIAGVACEFRKGMDVVIFPIGGVEDFGRGGLARDFIGDFARDPDAFMQFDIDIDGIQAGIIVYGDAAGEIRLVERRANIDHIAIAFWKTFQEVMALFIGDGVENALRIVAQDRGRAKALLSTLTPGMGLPVAASRTTPCTPRPVAAVKSNLAP